nr:hypothetical protein CFP56_60183 [Quercus suber]
MSSVYWLKFSVVKGVSGERSGEARRRKSASRSLRRGTFNGSDSLLSQNAGTSPTSSHNFITSLDLLLSDSFRLGHLKINFRLGHLRISFLSYDIIGEILVNAKARILNLDLCNPCRFLEAYDCKGEQCDLRQYFDTESGLAKLEAIVNLNTKKFFVSNFRKAGEKKAARIDPWYKEAVSALNIEVPAYEEDKASFNRVKEDMGAGWVKNEFHSFGFNE